MTWLSTGRITTAIVAEQVLLDTGPLSIGPKNLQFMGSSTINTAFELQWRNATNLANIKSQVIAVSAFTFVQVQPFLRDLDIQEGERIRVVSVTAVTGAVSASLEIPM